MIVDIEVFEIGGECFDRSLALDNLFCLVICLYLLLLPSFVLITAHVIFNIMTGEMVRSFGLWGD